MASGDPLALPASGELPTVDRAEFEGMLVGARGQPVVVNVWASWCAPCRTEMPLLEEAAEQYAGRVTFLGLASEDDPAAARAFLDDVGVRYPNVFDRTGEVRVAIGLDVYPTTYFFGADGVPYAQVVGGISEQRLAALIEDGLS